ncbi:MAG: single-stranded DNA-binding protein [Prevotella sp.]
MLNKILLQGRLVSDPELRHTQQNTPVASFRIAVDRDYKNKTTGGKDTDFINCVAWRGTAEFVSQYFYKGRMIVVEGRLQLRNYEDRDGNKRTASEVVASNIYFGDSKRDDSGSYEQLDNFGAPTSSLQELNDDDGDLPF